MRQTRLVGWVVTVCLLVGTVYLLGGRRSYGFLYKFMRPRFKITTLPPRAAALPTFQHKDRYRFVLVGDTGKRTVFSPSVSRAIRKEKKDFVIALGDLVYQSTPKCPRGRLGQSQKRQMDLKLGDYYKNIGAPVFLLLGNHGVNQRRVDAYREACLLEYAAMHKGLIYPSSTYTVDLGWLKLVVLNTNRMFGSASSPVRYMAELDAIRLRHELRGFKGVTLFAGHHVLRAYHDKTWETQVWDWLKRHQFKPDIYVNGHAHFLQFGVYGGIPAVTSGSGAKVRRRPSCPGSCGKGQLWGRSIAGYATLDITRHSKNLVFKDQDGNPLWRWGKNDPIKHPKKPPTTRKATSQPTAP